MHYSFPCGPLSFTITSSLRWALQIWCKRYMPFELSTLVKCIRWAGLADTLGETFARRGCEQLARAGG
jgi:hypothetical protein